MGSRLQSSGCPISATVATLILWPISSQFPVHETPHHRPGAKSRSLCFGIESEIKVLLSHRSVQLTVIFVKCFLLSRLSNREAAETSAIYLGRRRNSQCATAFS